MQNDNLESNVKNCPSRKGFLIVTIIAVLAIVFGAIVTFRLVKTKEAYQQTNDQTLINESKELARESLEVLETGDKKLAVQLALAGMPDGKSDRPLVTQSVYPLYQAMNPYDMGESLGFDFVLEHDAKILGYRESLDGKKVISVCEGGAFYIWDLESGDCLHKEQPQYEDNINGSALEILSAGISSDKAIVVYRNKIKAYSFDGKVLYEVPIEGFISECEVDREGKYVAIITSLHESDFNACVTFYDADTGEKISERKENVSASYHAPITFSEDGNYAAIAHLAHLDYSSYPVEEIPDCVSVFDIKTGDHIDLPVKETRVLDCAFTSDGGLAVNSIENKDINASKITPLYLQKFDITSGAKLWEKSYQYASSVADTSRTQMISAKFEGADSEVIAMVGTREVYVVNSETGEDISTLIAQNYIYGVGEDDTDIMVATVDGDINYYNYATGEIKKRDAVQKTEQLSGLSMSEDVLVAYDKNSTNLVVMSIHKDHDCFSKAEVGRDLITQAAASPSGKTYFLLTHYNLYTDDTYEYEIFDTKTGKKRGSFILDESITGKSKFYVDENTIALISSYSGEILYYSIDGEQIDSFMAYDGVETYKHGVSRNNKYAVLATSNNYYVVDIAKKKTIYKGSASLGMDNYSISDDGKIVCYTASNHSSWIIKCEEGSSESLLNNYKIKHAVVSPDGKTIVAICDDGYFRVVDSSTEDITNEIKFSGETDSFFEFSENGKQIYFQDTSGNFAIYDLEDKELKYITSGPITDIKEAHFDKENNILALYGFTRIYLFDLNSYCGLNYIGCGELYLPKQNIIVGVKGKVVKEFKIVSKEELIKEARKKYGKAKLTDAQKKRYKIN